MNCQQAKEIKITDYLNRSGFAPVKESNNIYWYLSPFRDEKTASFKVDNDKNVWYDFGLNSGGTLVDFVCSLKNCRIPEALQIISDNLFLCTANSLNSTFAGQKEKNNTIKIVKVKELGNDALLQYLKERKINVAIASIWLKEIYYTVNDKHYFALGFSNDSGGYELRNKYFKGSTTRKNISSFRVVGAKQLNIFEGAFDFLSYLTHFNIYETGYSCIILNSLIFFKPEDYKGTFPINSYLDNDKAGHEAFKQIKEVNSQAVNKSALLYPKYKDFNDFLCNKPMI